RKEGTLRDYYSRPASQPAVNLSHNPGASFLAHQYASHSLSMVIEGVENGAHIAAGHPKNQVYPGLFEHPRDRLARRHFFVEQKFGRSALRRHNPASSVGRCQRFTTRVSRSVTANRKPLSAEFATS